LGALLIDNLLLFSPLPPILGPYTFQSYSLRERYFTLIYMICGFLFLLFLSGGPGFILLFRKRKGKQVLFYQIVILGIFSLCSLFFASFIRSLPGDIDTLSFYYLNEEGQGYSVHSHFIGSTQKTIENLKIESSTPFYGLSPLGSPLPSASDYDKGSIALHSFYTKQEELRNFPQNLWGAIPLQVTQPTQRQDGFVVERGELINKTPYLYDKIVLLKIENKNTQPYSIKNRYNSGANDNIRAVAQEIYYSNTTAPTLEQRYSIPPFSPSTHSAYRFEFFQYLSNFKKDHLVRWQASFYAYETFFVGIPDGTYVLALGEFTHSKDFEKNPIQIQSDQLKQKSESVLWFQKLSID
jgi:hypothetical protein